MNDQISVLYPSVNFRPYIQCYLFPDLSHDYVLQESGGILEVLPSASCSLVLFFSEPSLVEVKGQEERYYEFSLTGYYSRPKAIIRKSSLRQMIIRFTPIGIQQFLDFKLNEITDSFTSIDHVFTHHCTELQDKLSNSKDHKEQVEYFERFYWRKLKNANPDWRIFSLVDYINKFNGTKSIKDISREVGIGQRTIQRLVHRYVGINFKMFSNLIRFQAATKLLRTMNINSKISSVAYDLGYFDQAHFIHDFKQLSKLTPTQYIRKDSMNKLFDAPNK